MYNLTDDIDVAYQSMLSEQVITAYHGSKMTFDNFDMDYLGDGNHENGPGFYLAQREAEAQHYGDVGTWELTIDNSPSLTETPLQHNIEALIALAHGVQTLDEMYEAFDEDEDLYWESRLSNFAESPYDAAEGIVNNIMTGGVENEYEAYLMVWGDVFGTDKEGTSNFLKAMITLGYDGVIFPGGNDGENDHYIMYNPKKCRRVG